MCSFHNVYLAQMADLVKFLAVFDAHFQLQSANCHYFGLFTNEPKKCLSRQNLIPWFSIYKTIVGNSMNMDTFDFFIVLAIGDVCVVMVTDC